MHYLMKDFAELEALGRDLFEQFLPGLERVAGSERAATWQPRVNFGEDEKALYVEALVPGVDPEKLDLSVQEDRLVLSGEFADPFGQNKVERVHARERMGGSFKRIIELPTAIDLEGVKASCRNGLLTIELPKAASARPKRIEVSMN